MEIHDNAIAAPVETLPRARTRTELSGLFWGAVGVLAFSLTLPATKIAVRSIDGQIVGLGRAVVAAACALLLLLIRRQPLPPRRLWLRLAITAAGVVLGFPLLSAIALQSVPSSHAAMVVGLLPAASAILAVVRAGERPSPGFWMASAVGLAAILVFCSVRSFGTLQIADLLLLGAVLSAAVGYTEGTLLARELGSWQVICWALVLSAPVITPVVCLRLYAVGWAPTVASAAGFAYVSLVSMFVGFFAWYRGLAIGGIARVGQLQLMQPILTLLWSHLLLAETVTSLHVATAIVVLGSVWAALRTRAARSAAATCVRVAALALAVTGGVLNDARGENAMLATASGAHHDVIFSNYGQLARSDELMRRFLTPLIFEEVKRRAAGTDLALDQQAIDLTKERFFVYVPSGPAPLKGYALMVFVSPRENATVPYGWTRILDKYGTIFVTAANSGNLASIMQRRNPLAVLGAYNIMQHYPVDPARVFIGGMSGGSRVAMRIALSYPDLFHGVFLNCGSDPIGDIEAPLPSAELFRQFQESTRLVYLTGQTDSINLSSDEGSRQSMRQWCVFDLYDEMMPYVGHEWASQREFEHALGALDAHVPADPGRLAACRAGIDQELNLKLTEVERLIAIGKFSGALASLKRIDAHFAGLAAPRSVELAREIASRNKH